VQLGGSRVAASIAQVASGLPSALGFVDTAELIWCCGNEGRHWAELAGI